MKYVVVSWVLVAFLMVAGVGYGMASKPVGPVLSAPTVTTPTQALNYASMLISAQAALSDANQKLIVAQGDVKTLTTENAKLEKNWSCTTGFILGLVLESILLIAVLLIILVKVKPATIATDAGKAAAEAQTLEADILALLKKNTAKTVAAITPVPPVAPGK